MSAPINIHELTYRNTTSSDHGVLLPSNKVRPEREWANVSLALVNATRLDDTRLELTSLGENGDWVNLTTDGINEATLFGVLRGEHDESKQGKHLNLRVTGVQPTTSATFFHKGDRDPNGTAYMEFDSTRPIGHTTLAYRAPVTKDPGEWNYPDNLYDEFVNVEDINNATMGVTNETKNQGLTQKLVQVNLNQVKNARVDPVTPIATCQDCTPLAIHLERAGANQLPLSVNLNTTFGETWVNGWVNALKAADILDLSTGVRMNENPVTGESKLTALAVDYDASAALEDVDVNLTLHQKEEPTKLSGTIKRFPQQAMFRFDRDLTPVAPVNQCGLSISEKLPGRVVMRSGVPGDPFLGVDMGCGSGNKTRLTPESGEEYVGIQANGSNPHTWIKIGQLESLDMALTPGDASNVTAYAEAGFVGARNARLQYVHTNDTNGTEDDEVLDVKLEGSNWPVYVHLENATFLGKAVLSKLAETTGVTFSTTDWPLWARFSSSEPVTAPFVQVRSLAPQGEGVTDRAGKSVETSIMGQVTNATTTSLRLERPSNATSVVVNTEGVDHVRAQGVFRTQTDAPGEGTHLFAQLEGLNATHAWFRAREDQREIDGATVPVIEAGSRAAADRVTVALRSPVTQDPGYVDWPDPGHGELVNVEQFVDGSRLVQLNLSHVRLVRMDPAAPVYPCADCTPLTLTLERDRNGLPLFAQFENTARDEETDEVRSLEGSVNVAEMPATAQVALGLANPEDPATQASADPGGSLSKLHLATSASGPFEQVRLDLTRSAGETPLRMEGSVVHLPGDSRVIYERNTGPVEQAAEACGYQWIEKLPGRLSLYSDVPGEPIEGLLFGMGNASVEQLAPGDAENFAGLQLGYGGWHALVKMRAVQQLDIWAGASEGMAGLEAWLPDGQLSSLEFAFLDTNETEGDPSDDVRLTGSLEGVEWPVSLACGEDVIMAHVGGITTPVSTGTLQRVHVHGEGIELAKRNVTRFEAELTEVTGGAVVETSVPGAKGFRVLPSTPDAGIFAVRLDADWEPPTEEASRACRNGTAEAGPSKPVHVEWALPVTHATFSITTERPLEGVPGTANWFRWTDRCETKTAAGAFHHLERVNFEKEGDVTVVEGAVSQRGGFTSQVFDRDDGENRTQRFDVLPLPTVFRLEVEIHKVKGHTWKANVRLDSEAYIDRVSSIKDGCSMLWVEGIEGSTTTQELAGLVSEAEGRGFGCKITAGLNWIGGKVKQAGAKVAEVGGEGAEARRAVDVVVYDVGSTMVVAVDPDGWSGQRDLPRFTRLEGTLRNVILQAVSEDRSHGTVLDLSRLAAKGLSTFDLQPQWWTRGLSSADALVQGSVQVPGELTEKRCWGEGENRECESWESVQRRVARTYLQDVARIFEGGSEFTLPWEAWKEAVR